MKLTLLLALIGSLTFFVSCAGRKGNPRMYRVYHNSIYDNPSGYWDVYKSRSNVKVKYNE